MDKFVTRKRGTENVKKALSTEVVRAGPDQVRKISKNRFTCIKIFVFYSNSNVPDRKMNSPSMTRGPKVEENWPTLRKTVNILCSPSVPVCVLPGELSAKHTVYSACIILYHIYCLYE